MATYRKKGKNWEVQVARKGVRKSASFRTKAEAEAWAAQLEHELMANKHSNTPSRPFSDLLERYSRDVSEHKRSRRWEQKRIDFLCQDKLAKVMLPDLSAEDFANWRDLRLREVSAATILRDWNILTHAINVAIKEWKWLKESPIQNVRKPATPPPRTRRITEDEIERLCFALGYDSEEKPETATSRVGSALLFAIETAMRVGEIVDVTWDQVDLERRTVHIPKTKNGFPRDVPLSSEAIRIITQLKPITKDSTVFDLRTDQVDALFRKAKARALIEGLHFHDSRREALTRLAKIFGVMELAKISGHRDLRILQSVYYAPSVEDLASKLDESTVIHL